MTKLLAKFYRNEDGVTVIEYGLIASLIAVALVTVLTGLGSQLNTKFAAVTTALH